MALGDDIQVSEAQIAVHWCEEEYYQPPAELIGQANGSDPAIFECSSEARFPECFKEYADLLTWDRYWYTTLDTQKAPFWTWFVGGRPALAPTLAGPGRPSRPPRSRRPPRVGGACLGG